MRSLPLFAAAVAATLSVHTASAQTAPPNAAGVSLGHIHLYTPDVAKTQKIWADMLGGQTMAAGPLQMVKFPGIFIILSQKATTTGGTGSVVDHIGFEVKDYPALREKAMAAGLMWRELTPNVQAFLSMPDEITVEIMENKDLKTPVAFHHIHASVPDQKAAQAWYIKEFGAGDGSRRNSPSAMFPGGEIDFLSSAGRGGKEAAPKPPTKGRALDHIGFEVKDLDAIAKKLADDGIKMDMAPRDMTAQIGLKIAFVTDPNGTYIELTQGLSAK
jgi:catechol 2,3-dioxygenase-like lactoylglutathione lyase family enzyme